jgi:hypothetical protein
MSLAVSSVASLKDGTSKVNGSKTPTRLSVIWLVFGREPQFSDGEYSKNAHLLSSDGFHNIFLLGIID